MTDKKETSDTPRPVEPGVRLRFCIRCNTPIFECMGFVLARDLLGDLQNIREQCSHCANRKDRYIFMEMLMPNDRV